MRAWTPNRCAGWLRRGAVAVTGRPVNAELVAALEDYLARRRALGFGLIEEERHARRFLEWLWVGGHIRASFTATQAVTWARGDGSFARSYEGQRLAAVRGLSRYCQATGMDVVGCLRRTRCVPAGIDADLTSIPRTRSTR